jgi:hypothetical protein
VQYEQGKFELASLAKETSGVNINRALHLVIPIDRPNGGQIYAHSTPISSEVFTHNKNWEAISIVYAKIIERGPGYILASGAKIAGLMLREVCKDAGTWDGPEGIERTLLAEIRRLTNILVPGERGWEMFPLDDARNKKIIDADDADEVESAIIFFTVFSRMLRKTQIPLLENAASMFGARTESLACSEFLRSLPTLTAGASTGVKAAA